MARRLAQEELQRVRRRLDRRPAAAAAAAARRRRGRRRSPRSRASRARGRRTRSRARRARAARAPRSAATRAPGRVPRPISTSSRSSSLSSRPLDVDDHRASPVADLPECRMHDNQCYVESRRKPFACIPPTCLAATLPGPACQNEPTTCPAEPSPTVFRSRRGARKSFSVAKCGQFRYSRACPVSRGRVACRLHRARSAGRSKPALGAVRGSGKPTGSVDESATGSVNFFLRRASLLDRGRQVQSGRRG